MGGRARMSQTGLNYRHDLDEAFAALRSDLIDDSGPKISTMRNYRFAIVPYDPVEEFPLRRKLSGLAHELEHTGWTVLSLSLQELMLKRLEEMGAQTLERLIAREKKLYTASPERAFNYVQSRVSRTLEGPDGLAGDISALIAAEVETRPEAMERAVVFLNRAGALYPFMRLSALLKHLDGHTHNVPVILFYPGRRTEDGLSFMDQMPPDRDYRPRIYP